MKIAFLTAGGIAPCLSSSIGALIEQYAKRKPEVKMIGYLNGYRGLLLGKSIAFPESVKNNFTALNLYRSTLLTLQSIHFFAPKFFQH